MRRDVQEIFRNTPHEKQVMMFSATLSKEIRPVCKKFMQDVCCSSYSRRLSRKSNFGGDKLTLQERRWRRKVEEQERRILGVGG